MAYVDAQIARGHRKHVRGDLAGALTHYRKAIIKKPRHPHPWFFFGLLCQQMRRYDEAIRALQYVVKLAPTHADAWYNLGRAFQAIKEPNMALAHYIAALEHNPNHVESLINAGNIYQEFGERDTAKVCYDHALSLDTSRPESRYTRAFLRLSEGDYERGWEDHEWRWACPEYIAEHRREFMDDAPRWDGSPMPGKALLIHWEQGFGDTIQFARWIPYAAERSQANIVIEVQTQLVRLFRRSFPFARVLEAGETYPHFDAHCSVVSLPAKIGGFGVNVPYLIAEPTPKRPSLRVGLCWGGNTQQLNDYNRSVAGFAMLEPITSMPGIEWLSLQVGERADECGDMPRADIKDFADTADAIAGLDLVITVDTSVAHVAGSIGANVWTMIPLSHDWCYPRTSTTSPWYPTMTLYRQPKRHDWASVIQDVARDLSHLASSHAA